MYTKNATIKKLGTGMVAFLDDVKIKTTRNATIEN